jgi:hypothetical protein
MPIPLLNAQTGTTYTFVASDAGKLVTLSNASAITLTIPPNSSVALAIGTSIDITQLSAGQVTIAAGAGVTINSTPSLKLRTQYSSATCIKTATDTWLVVGDLQAPVPAFGAYQSTLQALAAATYTKLQFQTEEFDTDNCFDNATNYRFTPTTAGYYQLNASMALSGASTEGFIQLRKNGSTFKSGNDIGGTTYAVTVSALLYLNGSSDYIEVFGYSGTALNTSASQASTYFNGCLVRGA